MKQKVHFSKKGTTPNTLLVTGLRLFSLRCSMREEIMTQVYKVVYRPSGLRISISGSDPLKDRMSSSMDESTGMSIVCDPASGTLTVSMATVSDFTRLRTNAKTCEITIYIKHTSDNLRNKVNRVAIKLGGLSFLTLRYDWTE